MFGLPAPGQRTTTRSLLRAAATAVIGVGLLTLASATPQGGRGATTRPASRATVPTPTLDALSLELKTLRKAVDYGVTVSVRGESRSYFRSGLHLGNGLIATSYVDGVELATPGTAQASTGTYRVLYLGSDSPFVSYFWLCDSAFHEALPVPSLAPVGQERELGELLYVVGSRRCKLITTGTGFASNVRRASRPERRADAGSTPRFRRPFLIHESDIASGSAVLSMDGTVLGMVVQREESSVPNRRGRGRADERATDSQGERSPPKSSGESKTEAATAGASKSERSTSERREQPVFNVVFDVHYLLRRAGQFEKPKAGRKRTVGIYPGRRWRRGAQPGDGEFGIRVNRVHLGSPAARAGVKAGDHWITLGGRKLENTGQLREALDALSDGDSLEIGYLRKGLEGPQTLRIQPN